MHEPGKSAPPATETIQLDPVAVLTEMGGYLEVQRRADTMVQDYLWTRVRVLATSAGKLEAANRDMAGQLAAAREQLDRLQGQVDALTPLTSEG